VVGNVEVKINKSIRLSIMVLLVALSIFGYPEYKPLPQITAYFVAALMSYVIGVMPITSNNLMFFNIGDRVTTISISPECSGFILMSTFVLITFLMPNIDIRHRLISVLTLPVIYMANIMRIVLCILLGIYTNTYVMVLVHESIGQVFLLVVTTAIYIRFLKMFGYLRFKKVNP
jgi:exosortase/archaeosortase family protein